METLFARLGAIAGIVRNLLPHGYRFLIVKHNGTRDGVQESCYPLKRGRADKAFAGEHTAVIAGRPVPFGIYEITADSEHILLKYIGKSIDSGCGA